MASSLAVIDRGGLLVADASTIINLNAAGCAREILLSLPCRLAAVDVVMGELELGRCNGRRDADLLGELADERLVEIVALDERGLSHFEQLVVGTAADTLDDGEAATIAHAAVWDGIAVIDERKATRICSQRFPNVRTVCTVDLFAHPKVRQSLGDAALEEAVFNALKLGRMRVFQDHTDWVVDLIGAERAVTCTSLPYAVRSKSTSAETG